MSWTQQDSDIAMQECKSILRQISDQADDDQWVANTLVQLCKDMVAEMNQTPCDTCLLEVNGSCVAECCPNL